MDGDLQGLALDAVGHAVFALDLEQRVTLWNRAAQRLLGRAAPEAVTRPVGEVLSLDSGTTAFAAALEGQSWTGTLLARARDGQELQLELTVDPVLDDAQRVVGVVCAARPAPVPARARHAVDAAVPQAVVSVDGVLVEVNSALFLKDAAPQKELVGRRAAELIHPDDRERAQHAFARVVSGEASTATVTLRFIGMEGEVGWGLTNLVLLRDADGRPEHVAFFVQDVTAEHQAREAAEAALDRLHRSEQRFRALMTRSADAALILDDQASILYSSNAMRGIFGYEPEDLVGLSAFDFVHEDDLELAAQVLAEVLGASGAHPPFLMRARTSSGDYIWTEGVVTNSLDDPDICGIVLNLRDVTARKQADDARQQTERKYREIVESAEEGIWILDDEGITTFINPRGAAMIGRRVEDIVGRAAADFTPEEDAFVIREVLRGPAGRVAGRYEARLVRADGQVVQVLVSSQPHFDEDGAYLGLQAMITDVSALKAVEEQLRYNALHDPLTGLANRTLLADRVEQMLARARRHDSCGAVLFVDLDNFKMVNDTYGHDAGDRLLVQMADRILSVVRAEDSVARFGGDEFAIVCELLDDPKEAQAVAARVLEAVAAPVVVEGRQIVVTASVGVAYTPADSGNALLRNADFAMYRAKSRGRACVEVFDARTHELATRDLGLANDLRRAVTLGEELVLHYQPIVSLADRQVRGAEALVRWQHPVEGLIGPDTFIPIAEQVGLIAELDRRILLEACRQAAEWVEDGTVGAQFVVAVNVSGKHFHQPTLVAFVREALTASGLSPRQLTIEVTETALVVDDEGHSVRRTLAGLQELGVSVALDDFGTGYSSLTYLKSIPANHLKIDRSFVSGLGEGGQDDAIVAGIMSLADSIGLECIAEGVETQEQLAALQQLGCALGQGYLWSRPVPAADFSAVV